MVEMRGMGLRPQGVDHEHFNAPRDRRRLGRHGRAIREVGQQRAAVLGKYEPRRGKTPVGQLRRRHVQVAQRKCGANRARIGAHVVAKGPGAAVENERINAAQFLQHLLRRVERHLAILRLAKASQIIQAHHVVGVRVRVEHRIHAAEFFAQRLRAEVRRRIDEELDLRRADERRGAQPLVARILRTAHRAIARDHRHALRGARAKEGDLERRRGFHSGGEAVIFRSSLAMLASLRIRNFALVESLTWDVPAGFVAITGETGAGKSILIGGLKLLLGERADKSAIRAGENECLIEAIVQLPAESRIPALLADAGAEPCEDGQLLLKRVISATGAGKQFVNGSPATLALLRQIGDRLIDLHGPHDHQSLFAREAQTRLLDAFAGAENSLADYRTARAAWLTLEREQAESESAGQAREREIDLLSHQVGEIEAAALDPNEEETLLARQQTAANARRLQELAAAAVAGLSEAEDSAESRLADIGRLIRELARLDPTQAELVARHTALAEETSDLARALSSYGDHIDADPQTLADLEARLDLIQTLKRKYGRTLAEVIAYGAESAARLAELQGKAARSAHLEADITAARERTLAAGARLSKARAGAAPKLAATVRRHLADLGFLKAGFEIRLEPGEPGPDGLEAVEFVFAPNPGEPAQPLRSIASSGEISRVMLALKTALATQDEVPVLVFDEIDANVGGEVSHAVGAKMREIGERRQVLCITHLPQVASSAAAHFVVSKAVTGGRTISKLTAVSGDAREAEIARMLGNRSGDAARAHARELLGA